MKRMKRRAIAAASLGIAFLSMAAGPALAHHPMGGELPSTFIHGLLSGLGHPVIGADHLAFIVALGVAVALIGARAALIGAFVAASTAGVLVHLAAMDVPAVEPLIASSVIAAGLLIAFKGRTGPASWLVLAALAGVVHGYAFGESIIGAERTVIGAYLVGIALVTAFIATVVSFAAASLLARREASVLSRQLAGGAIGLVGAGFLAMSLIGT
jgi:urease accessory protein